MQKFETDPGSAPILGEREKEVRETLRKQLVDLLKIDPKTTGAWSDIRVNLHNHAKTIARELIAKYGTVGFGEKPAPGDYADTEWKRKIEAAVTEIARTMCDDAEQERNG